MTLEAMAASASSELQKDASTSGWMRFATPMMVSVNTICFCAAKTGGAIAAMSHHSRRHTM
jgi:hypothetical protein